MACIRKRRGKYVVDYRDSTGLRRWVTCETRDQADGVLADKIKESRQAAPAIADKTVTVKTYGAQWLTGLEGQVRPRTLAGYRDIFNRYIEPKLGALKLLKLHRGRSRRSWDNCAPMATARTPCASRAPRSRSCSATPSRTTCSRSIP
jgi:Phage integrase, N-terminal SAM-like domain